MEESKGLAQIAHETLARVSKPPVTTLREDRLKAKADKDEAVIAALRREITRLEAKVAQQAREIQAHMECKDYEC